MKKVLNTLIVIVILISGCKKDDINLPENDLSFSYNYKVPLVWNQMFLEMERYSPGYRPPVSARTFAYLNLMAYESIVNGSNGNYNSFSGFFPGLIIEKPNPQEAINWEISLHAAYEKGFELFFPVAPAAQQFQMLDVAHALNEKMLAESDPATYQNSIEYGKYVAQTVYEWSKKDAWGHEAYLSNSDPSYLPPQGVGLWKPTYPDFSPALLPHWGKVRTFAALATDKSIPPLDFNTNASSELFAQAKETKELVDDIKAGLEDEQLWIAEFWSDDCPILTFTPAGRWVSITNQLIGQESLNMMDAVLVYARLGFALSDAGVKCWAEKYKHNCLRPIDFIREYMGDPDWNTVMCPDGTGGYYTPNFPTFPSGHATFSGAAAVVLEDFFGRSYRFTDRSHEGRTEFRGAPRTFNSFREMAEENAYSRIPLGVHFKIDSDAGTDLGYRIGERVLGLPWK